MKANNLLRAVIFAAPVCVMAAIIWYFTSFSYLTVNYKNAHDVVIYKTSTLNKGKANPKPVAELGASGEKLKLRPGEYTLHYSGDPGYESKYMPVKVATKEDKVSITPARDDEYLTSALNRELPTITQVILQGYPDVSGLYDIQPGKLYKNGDWYGTTLKYFGTNYASSDTLRIVLHKENGSWVVMTNPPDINLSKYSYPDVPLDILRDVNLQ